MDETGSLKQIIEKRRSIYPKEYTQTVIPDEVLEEILNAATFAPNHKNTKPWRFRVFRKEEKIRLGRELQRLYRETAPPGAFMQKKFDDFGLKANQADTLVTISVNFSGLLPEWEEVAATAMAVQNMYLTCTAHHIGCYWSSHKISEDLRYFLELEQNQRCLGLFYLGSVE